MHLQEIINYEKPYALMIDGKLKKTFAAQSQAIDAAPKDGSWKIVDTVRNTVVATARNMEYSPEDVLKDLQTRAATAGD